MVQIIKIGRLMAVGLAMVSMVAMAGEKDLPWQKKPDQSGRPTPENPSGKEKPALDQVPDECAVALSEPAYVMLAEKLSQLTSNTRVVEQLRKDGLSVTNVSWQDVGRSAGSSGGFNIADVRLVAITKSRDGKSTKLYPMPIIRLPNYEDKTVDIDLEKVMVPVGNSWGAPTFAVPLKLILENPTPFLSFKEKLKKGSLLKPRDTEVLVSAQASIMPVPKKGQAHFAPSIFSYSSSPKNPAVLVILVSNQGTSITIVDNSRDPLEDNGLGASGQMLFHNKFGEKAPFTLEALSEVVETQEGRERIAELKKSGQAVAGVSGVNQVLMIQVPLKHKSGFRGGYSYGGLESFSLESVAPTAKGARGLDTGVVGVAEYTLGAFTELDGMGDELERDGDAPIRVDVVRYMASDTADLTSAEVDRLPEELRGIYEAGENLGSLVTDPFARRVTRNYRPFDMPWWSVVVRPCLPPMYRNNPGGYFEPIYGPNWVYRFGTEEAAAATLAELKLE
jgi:hypothetical protein